MSTSLLEIEQFPPGSSIEETFTPLPWRQQEWTQSNINSHSQISAVSLKTQKNQFKRKIPTVKCTIQSTFRPSFTPYTLQVNPLIRLPIPSAQLCPHWTKKDGLPPLNYTSSVFSRVHLAALQYSRTRNETWRILLTNCRYHLQIPSTNLDHLYQHHATMNFQTLKLPRHFKPNLSQDESLI